MKTAELNIIERLHNIVLFNYYTILLFIIRRYN